MKQGFDLSIRKSKLAKNTQHIGRGQFTCTQVDWDHAFLAIYHSHV